MKNGDEYFMQRCFTLAKKGAGYVSPNPLVGAVIVKNGKVLGEGYHQCFGENHAEINAINDALCKKKDITGSEIYINLEPCFHQGNTPPCVNTILQHKFSRVIIASKDPNPLVSGRSIQKLKRHGVHISVGILEKEASLLNEKFLKYITTGLPFVSFKAAQTANGFIARADGTSRWISNKQSRTLVHRLRSEYDSVLVGANTVILDDPELTVRLVKGRNPIRIVIDGSLRVPFHRKILNSTASTILYTARQTNREKQKKIKVLEEKGIVVVQLPLRKHQISMKAVLIDLADHCISSLLVEGGQQTYTSFLQEHCVDKMYLFTSKKKFKKGLTTFHENFSLNSGRCFSSKKIASDTLQEIYFHS